MKFATLVYFLLISLCVQAQTVYATPTGKKYHMESCRTVNNVSKKLKLKEAIEIGLTACKICKPPTEVIVRNNLVSPSNKAKGESQTVQCKGRTKAGNRCKHKTSIANGYCFQHNPDK